MKIHKRMRSHILVLGAVFVSVTNGFGAATLVENFEGLEFNDTLTPQVIDGVGGWADDETVDFSFLGMLNGSQAAVFGPIFEAPTGTEASLRHEVTRALAGTEVSLNFSVVGPDFLPGQQDGFGFSLWDGPTSLFSLSFEPPGGVGGGDLQIFWADSSGTPNTPTVPSDIFYALGYDLDMTFTASGANVDFSVDINGFVFGGTLAGAAGSNITDFSADYTQVDDGDSFLLFDNVSIIPEPQTAVLGLLALVGFGLRRRRC